MIKQPLFFLLIAIIISSCKHKQYPLTKEEVIEVINKFDNSWKNKNMHAVDSVLSPVYTYFTQSGGVFSRDSVVATAGELTYILNDMSRTEFEISLYDNTAVVSTRWKGKGNYRSSPFDEDQRCSLVIIKKDNKVEILSEHCTPIRINKLFH